MEVKRRVKKGDGRRERREDRENDEKKGKWGKKWERQKGDKENNVSVCVCVR